MNFSVSAYPIVYITTSFLAGILVFDYLNISFVIFILLTGVLFRKHLIVLFVLLGILSTFIATSSVNNSLLKKLAHDKPYVSAVGYVTGIPQYKYDKSKFVLKIIKLNTSKHNYEQLQELSQVVTNSKIKLYIGDKIYINGRLLPPKDEQKIRLAKKNITAVIYLNKPAKVTGQKNFLTKLSKVFAIRIENAIEKYSSQNTVGLLNGLSLGNINEMPEEQQNSFKRTGLFHIVAVSGANLAIIIGFILVFFRFFSLSKTTQAFASLIFIAVYALATGLSPSILRASFMALFVIIAWQIKIKADIISSIFSALFFLIVFNPLYVYDIGFQLSFAATIGIILLYRKLKELFIFLPKIIADAISVSISAQLATAPISAYYFNQFSLVSPITNTMLFAIISPVTILVLTGGLISGIFPFISFYFFKFADILALLTIKIASYFSSIGWSTLLVNSPSIFLIIIYYLFVSFLSNLKIVPIAIRKKVLKLSIFFAGSYLVMLSFISPASSIFYGNSKPAKFIFFDVGQADSSLIKSPAGAAILVDTGKYESVLLQELRNENVDKINLLVLSHFDLDHVGATKKLLDNYAVDLVMFPDPPDKNDFLYKEILEELRLKNVKYYIASIGQIWKIGDLKVEIIAPTSSTGNYGTENDLSLVAKISYKNTDVLYTGDIEETGQNKLENLDNLESEIIKIPHHGSADSADKEFLMTANPEYAVISVGEGNSYGHPSQKYLNLLKGFGVKIYRTDKNGNVTLLSDGNSVEVKTER